MLVLSVQEHCLICQYYLKTTLPHISVLSEQMSVLYEQEHCLMSELSEQERCLICQYYRGQEHCIICQYYREQEQGSHGQGKVREKRKKSRSGKSQGILSLVREI